MSNWDDLKLYERLRELSTTFVKEVKPKSIVFYAAHDNMSQSWADITSNTCYEVKLSHKSAPLMGSGHDHDPTCDQ